MRRRPSNCRTTVHSNAEWHEVVTRATHDLAKSWAAYRGLEDSANIAARELALGYLRIEEYILKHGDGWFGDHCVGCGTGIGNHDAGCLIGELEHIYGITKE